MEETKDRNYKKNKRERSYDAMASFKKSAQAYERFLRKPYSMTVGKIEVEEQEEVESDQ